jgi:hypothetical protein
MKLNIKDFLAYYYKSKLWKILYIIRKSYYKDGDYEGEDTDHPEDAYDVSTKNSNGFYKLYY